MQEDFVTFLNNCNGSVFVASAHVVKVLQSHGYKELKESAKWELEQCGKYYVVRSNTTIAAFIVGGKYEIGNGFTIGGSHIDTPYFKLKPNAFCVQEELNMVRVEYYGGIPVPSWFDRDLGVSGRIIIEENGQLKHVPISIKEPLYRMASCAPHLDKRYAKGMVIDKETETPAIGLSEDELMSLICERVGLEKREQIKSYDLYLCDCQPANLMGINKEFVVGQGIDDLSCSYGNLYGLIEYGNEEHVKENPNVVMSVFFDGEEVGSVMRQGAASVFLPTIIDRISSCFASNRSEYIQMKEIGISKSLLLSMDVGHAHHPNQSGHIERNQKVHMNKGLVIEHSSKVSLVVDQHVLVQLQNMAEQAGVPLQMNIKKQEGGGGGSTIGPHIAHFTGLNVIDFGVPMLSMHSLREVCGVKDVDYLRMLTKFVFEHFHEYSLDI